MVHLFQIHLARCSFKEEPKEASSATVRSLLCPSDSQRPIKCPAQCHSFLFRSPKPEEEQLQRCSPRAHVRCPSLTSTPFGA